MNERHGYFPMYECVCMHACVNTPKGCSCQSCHTRFTERHRHFVQVKQNESNTVRAVPVKKKTHTFST